LILESKEAVLNSSLTDLMVSTPGRVCLFGEHQDYLGLPVIASAISLRIYVQGKQRNDNKINISLPDLGKTESFELNGRLSYNEERDYFKSSVNVLLDKGITFSHGFECKVTGKIPINAGTSSSSALIVAWLNFLSRSSDQALVLPPEEIAALAYKAEVEEFGEPGGMMDHYSTALGNIIELESSPVIKVTPILKNLGAFVLGNSKEPKDTKFILARVKNGVIKIAEELKKISDDFSLLSISLEEVKEYKKYLQPEQYELLEGTIKNRIITEKAFEALKEENPDRHYIGDLMLQHHRILSDVLGISTKKIDKMIDAAMEAGAYGAKINGSGGGGCMFAYAPENPEKVLEAVKNISGEAYIIYTADGTREETGENKID
jgi:galactokinase